MVKLIFNPKNTNINEKNISSLSSKKKIMDLNPFLDIVNEINSNEKSLNEIVSNEIVSNKNGLNCTKDIIGLENCNYVLNEWYNNSINDLSSKFLLIIGPTGCGKTSLVELYCKENDITLYKITSENIKTKKDLIKDISLFCEFNFFKVNSKKLILIDEYQNGQSDLLSITDILNLYSLRNGTMSLKEKKEHFSFKFLPPILIISSDSKGSKLSDLKKSTNVYYINEIPSNLIKTWISKIVNYLTEPELNKLIKKCKSDKRLLLNTLEFCKVEKTTKSNNFINSFYKDFDINFFEFIAFLFENEPKNLNELYKIYESDGFMISNLVHENYLDFAEDIDSIAKSAEALSYGEVIFSDTYESSKSFLPEVHFINSICIPSYYSKSDRSSKNIRTSCMNNRFNIFLNNKKLIDRIGISIFDIFHVKMFINHKLIKNKNITPLQENYMKSIITSLKENGTEKFELIYKHFSEFKDLEETKSRNFTLKFKEKIKKII